MKHTGHISVQAVSPFKKRRWSPGIMSVTDGEVGYALKCKSGDLILIPVLLVLLCMAMDKSFPFSSVSKSVE